MQKKILFLFFILSLRHSFDAKNIKLPSSKKSSKSKKRIKKKSKSKYNTISAASVDAAEKISQKTMPFLKTTAPLLINTQKQVVSSPSYILPPQKSTEKTSPIETTSSLSITKEIMPKIPPMKSNIPNKNKTINEENKFNKSSNEIIPQSIMNIGDIKNISSNINNKINKDNIKKNENYNELIQQAKMNTKKIYKQLNIKEKNEINNLEKNIANNLNIIINNIKDELIKKFYDNHNTTVINNLITNLYYKDNDINTLEEFNNIIIKLIQNIDNIDIYEENKQLQKALEKSKLTAENEKEKRIKKNKTEEQELEKAIHESIASYQKSLEQDAEFKLAEEQSIKTAETERQKRLIELDKMEEEELQQAIKKSIQDIENQYDYIKEQWQEEKKILNKQPKSKNSKKITKEKLTSCLKQLLSINDTGISSYLFVSKNSELDDRVKYPFYELIEYIQKYNKNDNDKIEELIFLLKKEIPNYAKDGTLLTLFNEATKDLFN